MVGEEKQAKVKFYGWINAAILFFVYAIALGFVFYGFTYIFPTMIAQEGWKRGDAAFAHTLRSLFVGFMAPVVAFLLGKLGAKKTINIGLSIGVLALFLLATATTQLWQWFILWGIAMPLVFSLGGMLPVQTTVMYWFNIRRATVMGLVLSAAPLAGSLSAPFYTFAMEKSGTWKTGWMAAAVGCILALIVSYFIKNKPQDIGQFPDGISPEAPQNHNNSGKSNKSTPHQTSDVWNLKEALRTHIVWLILVCMIGQLWSLYVLQVHGVLHLMDKGFSQMQGASVIGNLILFSGLSRFPIGILSDRIEPRILSVMGLFGMTIAIFGLWKPPESITFLLIIAAVYGFCFGTLVITFPMINANYFGPGAFPSINGFISPVIVAICAPAPWLAGILFDRFNSYDFAFIPIAIILFIGTICALFLTPPEKKRKQEIEYG